MIQYNAKSICFHNLVFFVCLCVWLQLGHIGGALSGAVNLMLVPETMGMYQAAGMLTYDGRCKTLDAAADG